MRGRRPDAASQDAKGNPGKRTKKGPSFAERLKALGDSVPSAGGRLAAPAIFGLEEFADAIHVWHELSHDLDQRNMLHKIDRHTLAMLCYYVGEFWKAVRLLAEQGSTQRVKTVSGGYMVRDHPAVRHRKDAADMVLKLYPDFGISPLSRHKLIREMVGTGVPAGGLFGGEQQPERGSQSSGDDPDGILGFAARNAERPSGKPN